MFGSHTANQQGIFADAFDNQMKRTYCTDSEMSEAKI